MNASLLYVNDYTMISIITNSNQQKKEWLTHINSIYLLHASKKILSMSPIFTKKQRK